MFAFRRLLQRNDASFKLLEGGKVGLLELTRPASRNALSLEMAEGILECTQNLSRQDNNVRVLVISGGETSFCAGRDLKATLHLGEAESMDYTSKVISAVKELLRVPIPVICGVEKICLGLGLEIALTGDIRVCGASTRFGFPEINLSIFPGCGGAYMLPALLGNVSVATDWILTGRRVSATEAHRVGLVSAIVPDGDALAESIRLAKELSQKNRDLLIKTKQVVKHDFHRRVFSSDWVNLAEQHRAEVAKHPDHLAALERFSERT